MGRPRKVVRRVLDMRALGDLESLLLADAMRKWLSGRASPCQGEGRGFESRLPLPENPRKDGENQESRRSQAVGIRRNQA